MMASVAPCALKVTRSEPSGMVQWSSASVTREMSHRLPNRHFGSDNFDRQSDALGISWSVESKREPAKLGVRCNFCTPLRKQYFLPVVVRERRGGKYRDNAI